jgi:predicted transport protein
LPSAASRRWWSATTARGYGTGDLEVVLTSMADLEKAATLIQRAYEGV